MILQLFYNNPQAAVLLIASLVFSLCFHEFSHAYIAFRNGDDTAARYGRLTLNPLKHLDPIGSLMLLIVGFGYAKPVPVNPHNLNNPRKDMIKVAAAGPISNLLLSIIGMLVLMIIIKLSSSVILVNNVEYFGPMWYSNNVPSDFLLSIIKFLTYFCTINIYLAFFNLIPMYPLDGGQIFGNIIAKRNPAFARNLMEWGPKILLGMILFSLLIPGFSIFGLILEPIRYLVCGLLIFIMDTLTFFL